MGKMISAELVGYDEYTSKAGKPFRKGYFKVDGFACNVEGTRVFECFLDMEKHYVVGEAYEFVYHKGDYIEV